MEENKKLLLFLPANQLWARVVRRGVVVAFLTFIAILLKDWLIPTSPEAWVPLITAILVALDKLIRDLKE
jgi:hypothetical protein